jgi:hypothetical protein
MGFAKSSIDCEGARSMRKGGDVMTQRNPEFQSGPTSPPYAAVTARLQAALAESPYPEIRRLQCECRDETLAVEGRVSSYYLKQLVVSLVQRCGASAEVQISIEVK